MKLRGVRGVAAQAYLRRLKAMVLELFPERRLYVRSRGEIRGLVLTTGQQATAALGLALLTVWMGVGTAAFIVQATGRSAADQEVARTQAKYERWIADSNARLNSAMVQIDATNGSVGALAATLEKRQAALEALFQSVASGKAPGPTTATAAPTPASAQARIEAVQLGQERLVATTTSMAKTRAERLRLAFKLAGLNPESYIGRASASLGGPLIAARDPQALAAVLDVDQGFAERIQQAAGDLADMRALGAAAQDIPFARPTNLPAESSSFGVRLDPFTHLPAFHSGLDFPGALSTPIYATAPGVVSFTGPRSGYGSTVEIDHGGGLKTRYAHLQSIAVRVGQKVATAQRIGAMGSTGRSTGPHLHYEVWVGGKAQNPERFLKAGAYVQ